MPYKLAGKTMPEDASDIIKNAALWTAFKSFVDSNYSSELYQFIEKHNNNASVTELYRQYLAPNAPDSFGFTDAPLRDEIDRAAVDLTSNDWPNLLDKIAARCFADMTANYGTNFYKSEQFKRLAYKVVGNPKAVAKRLGISDSGVGLLGDLMIATSNKDTAEVKKIGTELLRNQGLKMPLEQLVAALRGGRVMAPAPTAQEDAVREVTVSAKALALCGFSKHRERKVQDLVEKMLEQHVSRDAKMKREAKVTYGMIQKLDKAIKDESFDNMMKLFKRFKVMKS